MTTAYTPEWNGFAKRTHGKILSFPVQLFYKPNLRKAYGSILRVMLLLRWRMGPKIARLGRFPKSSVWSENLLLAAHSIILVPRTVQIRAKTSSRFSSRWQKFGDLFHVRGGIYTVLENHHRLSTKHLPFLETNFSGEWGYNGTDSSSWNVYIVNYSAGDDSVDEGNTFNKDKDDNKNTNKDEDGE